MSAVAESQPGPRWRHRAHQVAPWSFMVLALMNFLGGTASAVIGAVTSAVTVAVALLAIVHRGEMCEACLGGMPLDGPAQGERRRGLFRLWHRKWAAMLPLLPLVPGLLFVHHRVVMDSFMALTNLGTGASLWVTREHSRLSPWCPFCRHRGDGDGDVTPAPEPVGGASR